MVMKILGNRRILGNSYNTVFHTNSVIQTVWLIVMEIRNGGIPGNNCNTVFFTNSHCLVKIVYIERFLWL